MRISTWPGSTTREPINSRLLDTWRAIATSLNRERSRHHHGLSSPDVTFVITETVRGAASASRVHVACRTDQRNSVHHQRQALAPSTRSRTAAAAHTIRAFGTWRAHAPPYQWCSGRFATHQRNDSASRGGRERAYCTIIQASSQSREFMATWDARSVPWACAGGSAPWSLGADLKGWWWPLISE
jgi:hypothetical protein